MRTLSLLTLFVAATAANAGAQARPAARASIDSAMTRDQVIARLGKPASEHSNGDWTFLYYRNGMEKTVGMSDMVALHGGKVVDAVFRSPSRTYTGHSSSPAPVPAAEAIAKGKREAAAAKQPPSAPAKKP